jgi:hypothetical protein
MENTDKKIVMIQKDSGKHLGMDADEVIRPKQITGLAALFKDNDFSKSWEAK